MFLEVLENKIVSVNAVELQKSSSFYLLPQSEQLKIHQEINDLTSNWVKEKIEEIGEENITQEMCDEKMTEYRDQKLEEYGIHEISAILINGVPTYIYENEEDAKGAYESFKSNMMEGTPYLILHSEYMASKAAA